MKNIIKITVAFFFMGMVSCDFLDVVPDDTATLDHAFSNRSVTDKFLRTCYSHLPDPTDPFYYPAHFTSKDELICETDGRGKQSVAGQIADGLQNANNPLQNYWSGVNGGKNLYTAIRDCNIFLNNIHVPKDLEDWERTRWTAEVKFLKAYYHFFLMQLYGPIVIVDEEIPLSTSPKDLMVYREPVDECVDYIVGLLDEAIPDLPLTLPDPATETGRISQTIALSVKAKVLVWAASPLFNGNADYKDWVDNRGKQLISDSYDASKWERAATAIKNAIDTCHLAGLQLYVFNKYSGGPQTYNMNDTLVQMMTIRKAITEDIERNTGVIWATQETFADGKGGMSAFKDLGNMLKMLMPFMYSTDHPLYFNYYNASWHMVELFYTNNGVPMDEDKTFNYAGRFGVRRATPGDKHESYIATGETTSEMHFNREPRFYADLAFDRGFVELASATSNGGASFSPFMQWRYGEVQRSGVPSGMYSPKKIIAFETSGSKGATGQNYSPHDYRFPLIRMADLYLLYSEALNEVKAQPDSEVYYWIDKVRENAGLNGVVASWLNASVNPDKPNTKNGMREIIQRERLIELAFEGQRFWDIRRWKTADKYWSLPPTKWTTTFKDPEEFYVPMVYDKARQVTFRDYLYPLREYDLRVNRNLVQTYGW